jgi:hypothetical protein
MLLNPSVVMAGLVPAIHVFVALGKKDVDARPKAGHDGRECALVLHTASGTRAP